MGRATALAFAREVAAVAICGRDREALDGVLHELAQLQIEAVTEVVDVADEAAVNAFASRVTDPFGRVDAVVANAGIAGPTKPMHQTSLEEWREGLARDREGRFMD